jgi:hypothetical protein
MLTYLIGFWKKNFSNLLIFAVGLTAFMYFSLPLFHPGLSHQVDNPIVRIRSMSDELKNGQFPVRYSSDLARQHGYMLFNYYAPGPFYISAIMNNIGINIDGSLKRTFLLALTIAFVGMLLFAGNFFGFIGGIVSAVWFIGSPFMSFDIYWRGGLGEVWAMSLLPFVFLSIYKILVTKKTIWMTIGAASLGLFLICHNLSIYLSVPFIALWTIYWVYKYPQNWTYLFITLVLEVGLAAFFIIPAFIGKGGLWVMYLQHDMNETFKELNDNLISFLYNKNQKDIPDIINWTIILPPLVISYLTFKNRKLIRILLIPFICLMISFLMLFKISYPVWASLYHYLYILQFSWRYIEIVTFFSAFITGALFFVIHKKYSLIAGLLLIIIFSINNFANIKNIRYEYVDYIPSDPCGTSWNYEYLPITVRKCLKTGNYSPAIVYSGTAQINKIISSGNTDIIKYSAGTNSIILVTRYNYPNFKAQIDGLPVAITSSDEYGLIQLSAPRGNHEIKVWFAETQIEKISDIISLSSLIIICLTLLKLLVKPVKRFIHYLNHLNILKKLI